MLAAICCLLPLAVMAGNSGDKPEPDPAVAAAARAAYSDKKAESYDFHWGRESPFLPSNATTDTGQFIDPKSFATAQYCQHCHQESHTQWRQSAHSNANRAPWYLKQRGAAEYGKGCGVLAALRRLP